MCCLRSSTRRKLWKHATPGREFRRPSLWAGLGHRFTSWLSAADCNDQINRRIANPSTSWDAELWISKLAAARHPEPKCHG